MLRTERYLKWHPFACNDFKNEDWYEDYKESNNDKRLGTTQMEYFIALLQSIIPMHLRRNLYAQQ